MTIDKFIYKYCRTHQITVSELAHRANLPRSSIYNMMDATKSTSLLNLTKLAITMQVHPQFLFDLEWKKYLLYGKLEDQELNCINSLIEPELSSSYQKDCSKFIFENMPDGSVVTKGETFEKTWRLQNMGSVIWRDRWLVCQDQDFTEALKDHPMMSKFENTKSFQLVPHVNKVPISVTYPNEIVDISVRFTAPDIPCVSISYWKMTDNKNNICFPNYLGVYVLVRVI